MEPLGYSVILPGSWVTLNSLAPRKQINNILNNWRQLQSYRNASDNTKHSWENPKRWWQKWVLIVDGDRKEAQTLSFGFCFLAWTLWTRYIPWLYVCGQGTCFVEAGLWHAAELKVWKMQPSDVVDFKGRIIQGLKAQTLDPACPGLPLTTYVTLDTLINFCVSQFTSP